ncbi:MAG: hypothetical protein ACYS80_21055 [Planctomycetota bacterium]
MKTTIVEENSLQTLRRFRQQKKLVGGDADVTAVKTARAMR